jgi:chaperonin GroES
MTNYENQEPMSQPEMPTQATSIRAQLESKNLAEGLDDDKMHKISSQVSDGFEYDKRSRAEWEKNLRGWTDLALQVKEEKTYPWVGAANVKYPLLSTAAMQFNARAYPSLIPATGDIVKCLVIGKDPDQTKLEQSKRVSEFMSYQLLHEMQSWEEDMDKLLIMLPIVGTIFKKTYYNPILKHNVSELVLPIDLVVNYWAKSLEDAERISQVILLNKRQLKERQQAGLFLDIDLGDPVSWTPEGATEAVQNDETMPYQIVEQHTYFDMDDDGYPEPYIITFDRNTRKVLRIVPRFDDTTIYESEKGDLQKIDAIQYYTKFSFIPNPDGGFYDIGFGLLLSPINEAVNTTINQLLDAGHINNLQGGFLGKGLKLKMGEQRWTPGEWKTVQTPADDLRKQVIPLPTKEPSAVLFQLMGTLISSGKELASVAEIFVGKMPGQNTPATTTMATIEQGMKVFTAVYKRVYRALTSEYKKLFKLNSLYLDQGQYQNVLDEQVSLEDFDDKTYSICPNADPSTPTQTEKLMKAQALMELLPIGILDPLEVVKRILDAQEQPSPERLFNQQIQQTGQFQPPPDPKAQEIQMKAEAEQGKAALKQQELVFKSEMQQRDQQFQQAMEAQRQEQELKFKAISAQLDAVIKLQEARVATVASAQQHQQKIVQGAQQHVQKMEQTKEQAKLQNSQKNSSKSGKSTQSPRR